MFTMHVSHQIYALAQLLNRQDITFIKIINTADFTNGRYIQYIHIELQYYSSEVIQKFHLYEDGSVIEQTPIPSVSQKSLDLQHQAKENKKNNPNKSLMDLE